MEVLCQMVIELRCFALMVTMVEVVMALLMMEPS